jgi:hypothetical protein
VDSGGPAEPAGGNGARRKDLEISLLNNFWERKIHRLLGKKIHRDFAAAEMRVTINPIAIPK